MDSLKRTLRNIFKRGKKNKQELDRAQNQQQDNNGTTSAPSSSKAPQLPPVQHASPLQSPGPEDPSQPIPPTHPLATGQHSEPQEAVPQNRGAQVGPPPPTTNGATSVTGTKIAKAEDAAPLESKAGVETSAADQNLATQNNDLLATQATTPGQSDEAAKDGTVPATALNDPVAPPKIDTSVNEAQSATPKENVPPTTTQTAPETNGDENPSTTHDHEEPPPLKAVRAAPGMSATSGPLEDFPEGGEQPAREE